MSSLDLNNALDFARATNSLAAGAIFQLGLPFTDPTKWEIQEGAYQGPQPGGATVRFHVFQTKEVYNAALPEVSDTGARRKAIYKFPYKDGISTDDLGREAEEFQVRIIFHGPNYLVGWRRLFTELQKPQPGKLIHPVRGEIDCVMRNYRIVHSSDQRQAMVVEIVFLEHTFNAALAGVSDQAPKDISSFLGDALSAFAKIENFINTVSGTVKFAQGFINSMNSALGDYQDAYGSTLRKLNSTFNGGQDLQIAGTLGLTTESNEAVPFSPLAAPAEATASDIVSRETSQAIAVQEAEAAVNDARTKADAVIQLAVANGAELDLYDELLELRQGSIIMQRALEAGLSTSAARIIEYVVPRIMSLREVAFANGISPDAADQILQLNPGILSVNYIEPLTSLRVPVSQ